MSQDSTKPGHQQVTSFDVSDENPAVLARRIDNLSSEVRDGFEGIHRQLLPAINRINDALEDIAVRLGRLERDRDDHAQRLIALEQDNKARRRKARK